MENQITNSSAKLQNHSGISKKLNEVLPVYMQFELKYSKKPVKIGTNFSFERINQIIQKRFPNAAQDLVTQQKLDKIYEGIVEIIRRDKETVMIFKNVVDVEIVKMYFNPHELQEASLIETINKIDIIILIFKQE
ncbi:hypothetical protein TTHERM_00580400 (macronuclear) [Tetrahymena thermophila SB210]|uniref:Uncharacterized protein n=1 Tax=Tetrahymena thermophila (strain SB210) TaxID=312017 RepID=I7MLM3_TETTS|nr:hypothetical protein TTHERM_00580400 [Tetrahymena thermophila SB210]EAS02697.1 hypothetical protein TTHERM_00580400 [Tetrahymena thermophila SB210]|eukprot:XP_001022942.1 hypothetical protein TTHERM_00580400 [Tetrahymena thermophila SB210]